MSDENLGNETISDEDIVAMLDQREQDATPPHAEQTPEPEVEASAADEASGEATESDGEAEAPEPEAENEPGDVYVVKVNGEEREVPVTELVKGYMLQSDYTKKTTEVAEQRKAFEAEREAVSAEIKQQQAKLAEQLQFFALVNPKEPDWKALQAKDPAGYVKASEAWRAQQDRQRQAQALHRQIVEQNQQKTQAEHAAKMKEARDALLEAIPAMKTPEGWAAETANFIKAGEEYGFTPQDINAVDDPRMLRALRDAAAYRKLQSDKPEITKKVAQAPVALRPGSKPSKTTASEKQAEAMKRLKKTGSDEDVLAVLMAR